MYPVSTAYKEAIQLHRTQGFRNRSYLRIYFGAFDATASDDATFSDNGHAPYAAVENIDTDKTFTAYASWEQNGMAIDGGMRFLPESGIDAQGFVSSAQSDANGEFTTPPAITILHDDQHTLSGLTLVFDGDAGAGRIAVAFTVTTYLFGEMVETHTVSNALTKCESELRLLAYDAMVIAFTGTRYPYQRIHLDSLRFGIGYVYENDDIIKSDHLREVSPVSLELPNNTLSFTLKNTDGVFDVDRRTSLLNFLREDQEVRVSYGYDVSGGGDIEWVVGGTYWLSSWEAVGQEATFSAIDIFKRLSQTTYRKSAYDTAATAAGRVEEVLLDAGIGVANVNDTRMQQEIIIANPLPETSHAAELQLIANVSRTTLENGTEGDILFRARAITEIASANPNQAVTEFSGTALQSESTKAVYAAWEQDFFALDGGMQFLPENGTYDLCGLVLDVLPTDGVYADTKVRIAFDGTATLGSVTLRFGAYAAPDRIRLMAYRTVDGVLTLLWKKDYAAGVPEMEIDGDFDRVDAVDVWFLAAVKARRPRLSLVSASWDSGFAITNADTLGNPTGRILAACRDIDAEVFDYDIGESAQISETKVAVGDWVQIDHGAPYVGVTGIASEGDLEYLSYAYCTMVRVTGAQQDEVTITLTGRKLEQKSLVHAKTSVSLSGENCVIFNPLLTSNVTDDDYLSWLNDYLASRIEWEIQTLGYPELQPADSIVYRGEKAYVKATRLTYNGALRGTVTLRKKASA